MTLLANFMAIPVEVSFQSSSLVLLVKITSNDNLESSILVF